MELQSEELSNELVNNGITIASCHVPCNPPQGYYTNVSIMGLKAYVEDESLKAALEPYGTLKSDIIRLKYKKTHDLAGLENGNRMVRMILKGSSIPYAIKISGEYCRIIHNNQQPVCSYCNEEGHTKSKCPSIECRQCGLKGHIARSCKNSHQTTTIRTNNNEANHRDIPTDHTTGENSTSTPVKESDQEKDLESDKEGVEESDDGEESECESESESESEVEVEGAVASDANDNMEEGENEDNEESHKVTHREQPVAHSEIDKPDSCNTISPMDVSQRTKRALMTSSDEDKTTTKTLKHRRIYKPKTDAPRTKPGSQNKPEGKPTN